MLLRGRRGRFDVGPVCAVGRGADKTGALADNMGGLADNTGGLADNTGGLADSIGGPDRPP